MAAIAAAPAAGLTQTQVLDLIAAVDAQPLGVLAAALFVCVPAGILLLGIAAVLVRPEGSLPLVDGCAAGRRHPGDHRRRVHLDGSPSPLGWVVTAVAFGAAGWVYASQPECSLRSAGDAQP